MQQAILQQLTYISISVNFMKKIHWLILWGALFSACSQSTESTSAVVSANSSMGVEFNASNAELVKAFQWAKHKALSYAHDTSDLVGYWYEAALPNREAFCMRDVSHQAIGAEILGLHRHNYNMMLKFAQNISKEKDYCSYWEINRYNKPAPVDYETDRDFWYNLPANFDVIYNTYRLHKWTGNKAYLDNPDFKNFYELSLNEYVEHWDLGYNEVERRDRSMHLTEADSSRFGNKRGIPTYNEGGRGETLLGIDMTASLIAAYSAYAEMLQLSGQSAKANEYIEKAKREQAFMDEFWWDDAKQAYRSIWYEDETFDYFMVGDNQAFLHYLYYFNAIPDQTKITQLVEEYAANFNKLIVELKSYLPIIFYENGHTDLANDMILQLCSPDNQRRDYPENSYTVIEHITRGLMGIDADASSNTLTTLPRTSKRDDWAELKNVPLLAGKVTVKHFGIDKTSVILQKGSNIQWKAQIPGQHEFLYVNGEQIKSLQAEDHGQTYSWCMVELKEGDEVEVSKAP